MMANRSVTLKLSRRNAEDVRRILAWAARELEGRADEDAEELESYGPLPAHVDQEDMERLRHLARVASETCIAITKSIPPVGAA